MPLFDYTGQLSSGALFQGTLEAPDAPGAETALAQMGVRVTTLRPARRTVFVAPLSLSDVIFFTEQLAALTKAGLPLEVGLRQLASDVGSRKLKRLLLDLADDLDGGTPLPQALARQKQRFPVQYAGVVAAGLKTGDLAGSLYGLTTHLRLKSGFRRILLEIVAYPAVVLVLAVGVSSFLMRSVVPLFEAFLHDLTQEAYGWGQAVSVGSAYLFVLAKYWPAIELGLAAVVGLLILGAALTLVPGPGTWREWLLRRIPGVAQVYWSSVLARFTHTSALGAYGGTPLPELVAAGGAASGSPALARATQRVAEQLTRGETVAEATAREPDIPALWTCAVQVAAPRGDLPGALAELARTYELRTQQCVNNVRSVLGPLLFLLVAFTIGGIIASLLSVVNMFLGTLMRLTSF